MTFNISILLEAEGDQARAEVKALGGEAKAATGQIKGMGGAADKTSAQTKGLGSSANAAETHIQTLSAAQRANATASAAMGASHRAAAANAANLTAQGNDVLVMLMAGQNPMQLAMQQGTQISQVIGPMGAAGAYKALGGAILGMLNPISLVTIGSIAAGAAMVNWIRDAGPDAVTLDDALNSMSDSVDRYVANIKKAQAPLADLRAEYGEMASEARQTLLEQAEAERRTIERNAQQLIQSITKGHDWLSSNSQYAIADQFELHLSGSGREIGRELVPPVAEAYTVLNRVARGSVDEQIAAFERLIPVFRTAAEAVNGISETEDATLNTLLTQLTNLRQVAVQDNGVEQLRASYRRYYQSRITSEEHLSHMKARELAFQANIHGAYAQTRSESDAVSNSAQTTIAALQAQAALNAIVAKHGADSAEAVAARTANERQAFAAATLTHDMAQSTKDEIMGAWDAANRLSGVDTASGLSLAAAQAKRIADELARAVSNAASLANQGVADAERARINYEFRDDPMGRAGALATAEFNARNTLPEGTDSTVKNVVEQQRREFVAARISAARYSEQLRSWQQEQNEANKLSRQGGTAAAKQSKAAADLIANLQGEIEILQTSDPVQQEMLRNRDALAGATEKQRRSVEDLIAQRQRETLSLDRQTEAWTEMRSTTYGVFDDLRKSGGDLEYTFERLADRIQDMAYEAILLGEGPLAGILGGGQSGGLIGSAISAFFPSLAPTAALPARAEGGPVYGPGGPKSDDVLMWGSNGEFMMNAQATAKHRHLLELLNSGGSLPGYASGGAIGGGGPQALAPVINILPINNSSRPLDMNVEESTGPRGQRQQRLVISDAVADGLSVKGGGADRTLRSGYGLRRQGVARS